MVSMALTKIELGVASTAGTLLNGRVRRAVHSPEFSRLSRTRALSSEASWPAE
ncbi:hypothetical protein D3C78_1738930 [compost metagenome]